MSLDVTSTTWMESWVNVPRLDVEEVAVTCRKISVFIFIYHVLPRQIAALWLGCVLRYLEVKIKDFHTDVVVAEKVLKVKVIRDFVPWHLEQPFAAAKQTNLRYLSLKVTFQYSRLVIKRIKFLVYDSQEKSSICCGGCDQTCLVNIVLNFEVERAISAKASEIATRCAAGTCRL